MFSHQISGATYAAVPGSQHIRISTFVDTPDWRICRSKIRVPRKPAVKFRPPAAATKWRSAAILRARNTMRTAKTHYAGQRGNNSPQRGEGRRGSSRSRDGFTRCTRRYSTICSPAQTCASSRPHPAHRAVRGCLDGSVCISVLTFAAPSLGP
ncbi:hypothetical protein BV20DRAFT_25599 [Pilatotrama ljubarskyi]|nr:hypothetical protein BV20DRAFT_25599 [Pilatotrama ljubarskyi]